MEAWPSSDKRDRLIEGLECAKPHVPPAPHSTHYPAFPEAVMTLAMCRSYCPHLTPALCRQVTSHTSRKLEGCLQVCVWVDL